MSWTKTKGSIKAGKIWNNGDFATEKETLGSVVVLLQLIKAGHLIVST